MARTVVDDAGEVSGARDGAATGYQADETLNMAGRCVALVAAAVPTIIGLIALAKINWSPLGMDAPAVTVAGMTFRPWVAIGTVILGLFALAAAVSWDRESKLFVGAVLVALGIAIVVANPTVEGIVLNSRMGWLAIIVGGVLAVVGMVACQPRASRYVRGNNHGTSV